MSRAVTRASTRARITQAQAIAFKTRARLALDINTRELTSPTRVRTPIRRYLLGTTNS